jgi:hypothetical protein
MQSIDPWIEVLPIAWRHENSQLFTVYEDGALETFRAATPESRVLQICLLLTGQQCGGCSLKRRIAYPNGLALWMGYATRKRKSKRKDEEIALADFVICPSNFMRASLPLRDPKAKTD